MADSGIGMPNAVLSGDLEHREADEARDEFTGRSTFSRYLGEPGS